MKKDQGRNRKSTASKGAGKKRTAPKKSAKMRITGNTEILDLDLIEEEMDAETEKDSAAVERKKEPAEKSEPVKKESKTAVKAYGEKMPEKPVSIGDETLELLELDEILEQEEKAAQKKAVRKKEPQKKGKAQDFAGKKESAPKAAGHKRESARKKKKGGGDFQVMDAVIALTGVLVLFVAVVTFGIYRNAAMTQKQVEAMAQVGEKMETIGIAGEGVFVAVADARLAAQEISGDLEEETQEGAAEYEEKDLVSSVSVGLKLTSVQKDLKIKFTNKESGKLIGNQAFEVKIEGPENLTKTDDDKDGIIYINSITPGEYTVTVTAPQEVNGSKAAGIKEKVTVKDKIEYKKIDVADEVKKESEINAAKEDTAVATQVESVLTDTVEWVESTKTALDGGGDVYEEVKKSDIPEPSASAMLDKIWTADGKNGAYLTVDAVKLSENAASIPLSAVKTLEKGVYFSEVTTAEPTDPEQTPGEGGDNGGGNGGEGGESQPTDPSEEKPAFKVTAVSISGGGDYYVGDSVTLKASVETEGEGSLSASDYQWSGGVTPSGTSASLSSGEEKSYTVTVTVQGVSASTTVNFKRKPAEISAIRATADASRVECGGSTALHASVDMNDGSAYTGNITWSANGGTISGSGTSVTLTSGSAGKVTATATAGSASASVEVEFYEADKKVTKISIPDSAAVTVGGTASLSLTVEPSDAKDRSVSWKVEEGGDIISVDANGTVKGLKEGTAKVKAYAGDGSGVGSNTCTVTVSADVGVTMEAPGSMTVGEKKFLKCTTSGDISAIEWTVSDTNIAVIETDTGKVKAVAPGKVTVTVKVKGKNGKKVTATGELTVKADGAEEVKLDPSKITVKAGEKATIQATVTTGGSTAVEWKIDDDKTAKIVEAQDGKCVIQGLKPGKTKITAVSKENKEKTATAEITVELKDGTALLKDKDGNQLYYKDGNEYKEATVADYYKYDVFYRKKDSGNYRYTGWQTIDGKRYYFDKNGNPVTGDQIIQGMKYTFNSDGSLKVNGVMGIDVSKHNGNIDWNAVKNSGVDFVIIRCGYRGSATGVLVEDPKFKSNIQGAAAAGLKVGIYFFSQAVNEVEAVEEASMTVSLIRNYKITYPVFLDVEAANGRADGLDSAARTQVIKAYCETIRNSGYTAGVYANKTWLGGKMNVGSLGSYRVWLAQYASAPTYSGRYEMWQYSSTGKISGISGNVDLNISYLSY